MAFNYDLASSDTDIESISKVRFDLGDTVEDSGVLPDGSNLSDEEIQMVLDAAGADVDEAVGVLCGVLARRWAVVADIAVGPRRENLSQVSKRWQENAISLTGSLGGEQAAFVTQPVRSDGYSENAAGSEYAS